MVKREKLNQLYHLQKGIVLQSSWLEKQGYSYELQQRYRKSKWLIPVGDGAYVRTGDKVGFEGAIYALQKQSNLSIHPGGTTAFFSGPRMTKLTLFGGAKEKLPKWFCRHDWEIKINFHATSFFGPKYRIDK